MVKKWIIPIAIFLALVFVVDVGIYFFYPDVSTLKRKNPQKTAFMKYREQEWKKQGNKRKIFQRWVSLHQISPFVIKAVIIAEDDKFWSHEGFDFKAIQKAIEKDIKKKKFKAGGSTISQQLAKNLYLSPSKNPIRKLKEAILTWRIERNLSKKRIIELYLNIAEWGKGLFGIEAAAQHYYGKSASTLTAEEAAHLASVLPNPRRYEPTGESRFVESRSERIYGIMIKRGIVIPEYEEVINEPDEGEVIELESSTPQGESEDQKAVDGTSATVGQENTATPPGKDTLPPEEKPLEDKSP
jgi:monofunctional biosynthetic peptidoglycan transglycosylase